MGSLREFTFGDALANRHMKGAMQCAFLQVHLLNPVPVLPAGFTAFVVGAQALADALAVQRTTVFSGFTAYPVGCMLTDCHTRLPE